MHALANRPDLRFRRQRSPVLHRMVDHHLVEPAHQSLIGAEHDRVHDGVIVRTTDLRSLARSAAASAN